MPHLFLLTGGNCDEICTTKANPKQIVTTATTKTTTAAAAATATMTTASAVAAAAAATITTIHLCWQPSTQGQPQFIRLAYLATTPSFVL